MIDTAPPDAVARLRALVAGMMPGSSAAIMSDILSVCNEVERLREAIAWQHEENRLLYAELTPEQRAAMPIGHGL